jgi:hypothetical protein
MANQPRVTTEKLITTAADWWELNRNRYLRAPEDILKGARLALGSKWSFELHSVLWATELLKEEYRLEYREHKADQLKSAIEKTLHLVWFHYFESWSGELEKYGIDPCVRVGEGPNPTDEYGLLNSMRGHGPKLPPMIRQVIEIHKLGSTASGVKKAWQTEAKKETLRMPAVPSNPPTYWAMVFDIWELPRTERAQLMISVAARKIIDLELHDPHFISPLDS